MRVSLPAPAALLALAIVAAPALAHAEASEPRSPMLATTLALGGAGAGFLTYAVADGLDNDTLRWVALGTVVVGPSLGHFYAGAPGPGIVTMVGRVGGLGLLVTGAVLSLGSGWGGGGGGGGGAAGGALTLVGLGTFVTATAYDVLDAAPAARRYNAEVAIAPTVVTGAAGTVPGLALTGRF